MPYFFTVDSILLHMVIIHHFESILFVCQLSSRFFTEKLLACLVTVQNE